MVHMEVIHFFQISHLFTPLYPKKPPVTAEVVTTWRWCHQLFFKNIPVEFFHFSTARHKTSTRVCWLLAMPGILKKNGENFRAGSHEALHFFLGGEEGEGRVGLPNQFQNIHFGVHLATIPIGSMGAIVYLPT